MDFTSIFILAAAIICFAAIALFLNSGNRKGGRRRKAGSAPETVRDPEKETAEGSVNVSEGAHALHIPAGMLGDRRNAYIRGRVEEAVRDFSMEEGSEDAFLYVYTKELSGWICPYCEGENKPEDPICMICGRRPDEEDP
ncbi:MAG: hypothetical protein Q4C16_05975 [Eubacteriales bacterium]|jgi:hypothetical protein|nr:hypothetical protein [Eubacteriales bacterium]